MADNPNPNAVGWWVAGGTAIFGFIVGLWKVVKLVVASDLKMLGDRMEKIEKAKDEMLIKLEAMGNQRTADIAEVKAELSGIKQDVALVVAANEHQTRFLERIEAKLYKRIK